MKLKIYLNGKRERISVAFEIKLDPGQVDEAAASLVRIASKFKHNPPTSLGVIVGKSGIVYRRKEDGVYVLPITALRA